MLALPSLLFLVTFLLNCIQPFILSYQEGRIDPDNKIGRFISDAVGSIPKLPSSAFEKLVNDSLQVRLSFDHVLWPLNKIYLLSQFAMLLISFDQVFNTSSKFLFGLQECFCFILSGPLALAIFIKHH